MNTVRYMIELLTPKQKDIDTIESKLATFAEHYQKIVSTGSMVSIPDNPLGNLHYTAMETLEYLDIPLDPQRTLLHLNTFHRKQDMDRFLRDASDKGLEYLLVISGDGGPRLPRLEPTQLGINAKTVTSVELLNYITREFPNKFVMGVAFNQYEPLQDELDKLDRKIDAGAKFITTQPVIGKDSSVEALSHYLIPINLGAWMSNNCDLLYECVGTEKPGDLKYDPVENLKQLHKEYPDRSIYLSLLSFKSDWKKILPKL
jgi:methylenetetrahydrofolate reductase (NADPH)